MKARDARARGIQVHGDVPDHAELAPHGYRLIGDTMVRTFAWRWQMACVAKMDGSTPESPAIVTTAASIRAAERREAVANAFYRRGRR